MTTKKIFVDAFAFHTFHISTKKLAFWRHLLQLVEIVETIFMVENLAKRKKKKDQKTCYVSIAKRHIYWNVMVS